MTPGARAQAAIDLLDAIEAARGPADQCAQHFFRARRFVGAKDRAAISATVPPRRSTMPATTPHSIACVAP